MNRYDILLKKPPKKCKRKIKDKSKQVYSIPISRYAQIQTFHPKNGDLFIISLPGATQVEVEDFLKLVKKEFKDLNKKCSLIVLNH